MDKEITLQLNADEINLLLESLGQQPFIKVFGLIGKIQQQAARQLQPASGGPEIAAEQ